MKARVCISIVAFLSVFLNVWAFSADMIFDGGPKKKSNYKAVLRRLKEYKGRFLRANDLQNPEKNYKAGFKRI